jgi:hypothetical protein
MKFIDFLKGAFLVLKSNPKLFVPKILVAAVYGVAIVLGAIFIRDFYPSLELLLEGGQVAEYSRAVGPAIPFICFTGLWMFFSIIADIFVNAMYPAMLSDFKGTKPVSLKSAFVVALGRSPKVIPAAFFIIFISMLPALALSLAVASLTGMSLLWIYFGIAFIASIFIFFVFYYAFPVLVLEEGSALGGLSRGFSLSRKNAGMTLKASLIPFAVSLLDLYLAFDIFNPANFFLFVLTRFFIAVIATYHMTLEPILYFEVARQAGGKLQ